MNTSIFFYAAELRGIEPIEIKLFKKLAKWKNYK